MQHELTETEYYSVCTLIRSDEQGRYESALEASPELISQSALWELQSRRNTAGYLAERKEFFARRLAFITPWIRVHCHQLHGPSSTARAAMTSAVEGELSGQAFRGSTTAGQDSAQHGSAVSATTTPPTTTAAGTVGDAGFASVAAMLAQQLVDMKERLKSQPPHYFGNSQPLPQGGDQTKMFQANLTELNKLFRFNSCLGPGQVFKLSRGGLPDIISLTQIYLPLLIQ